MYMYYLLGYKLVGKLDFSGTMSSSSGDSAAGDGSKAKCKLLVILSRSKISSFSSDRLPSISL